MNWTTKGHNNSKKYFEDSVRKGVLSHAYLFSGQEGVGKKVFAHDVFRLINQREPENDPDFKFISPRLEEEETKIYVEDIRDVKSFLSLKPYYGPYKFVVINDADRLVPEAANAFLKILEEPSPFTTIILISSKPKLIIPTVLSRCEKITFLSLHKKEITKEAEKSIEEFLKISKEGLCERMQYAERLFTGKDYQNLVINLIYSLRPEEGQNRLVLKNLLHLNSLLSQPQFNHRLALENFLINLK
jgi:DNA polymerase-3 subunit delta'